jgi:hypothetical protein
MNERKHEDQSKLEALLLPYLVVRRGCYYIRLRSSVNLETDKKGKLLHLADFIDAIWDAETLDEKKTASKATNSGGRKF